MSLGTNIQYLRKLNKLTQEQFAEKTEENAADMWNRRANDVWRT